MTDARHGKWYTFRSTLDKLSDHLNDIEDDGDLVIKVEHVGGRDWVILCRKHVRVDLRSLDEHGNPIGQMA